MQSQTKIFSQLVRDYMRPPAIVGAEANLRQLLGRMAEAHTTSALVVDDAGKLCGIVTEHDVARRIALRCSGDEAVRAIMTTPAESVRADDYLYNGIACMRRFGWRHMPVVEDDGRPVGEIELDEALAVAGEQTVRQIERLTHEGSLDGLREIKAVQADIAADLLGDNVPAPEIQSFISEINRDIHRRVIDASLAAMRDDGWGAPPVDFALIIMGSGGRGENFLFPDQDNGFVLDDYPDAEHTRIDAFFIELAERMTRDLDAIGFPFCRGYVMATNPLWRKTRRQWREQLRIWGRRRGNIAVQLSDIFFDFRAGYGRAEFVVELRRHATEMIRNSPAYLQAMESIAHEYGVALGWFGRFITERDKPEHKGAMNLKHSGTLPLVACTRVLALSRGVAETSTLGRIAALYRAEAMDKDEQDYLSGAYRHITFLLLRQQLKDFLAGREVGNYVHPDSLSEREKDILVDSFKAIGQLRRRLHADFTGDVF